MATTGLKNVNMLSKEQYNSVSVPATDELYAISESGFGFPSANFEDLELGASGTTYTAPASGWFMLSKLSSGSGQYASIQINNVTPIKVYSSASGQEIGISASVQKGQDCKIEYTLAGTTNYLRFIYAEGE